MSTFSITGKMMGLITVQYVTLVLIYAFHLSLTLTDCTLQFYIIRANCVKAKGFNIKAPWVDNRMLLV